MGVSKTSRPPIETPVYLWFQGRLAFHRRRTSSSTCPRTRCPRTPTSSSWLGATPRRRQPSGSLHAATGMKEGRGTGFSDRPISQAMTGHSEALAAQQISNLHEGFVYAKTRNAVSAPSDECIELPILLMDFGILVARAMCCQS